jgi:hypothetical protein
MKRQTKPTVKEVTIRIRTTLSCARVREIASLWLADDDYHCAMVSILSADANAKVTRKTRVTDLGKR